jgi:hypothetical protein
MCELPPGHLVAATAVVAVSSSSSAVFLLTLVTLIKRKIESEGVQVFTACRPEVGDGCVFRNADNWLRGDAASCHTRTETSQ